MGVQVPVTLQPQYSLLSREIEWEIVPAALHNGIGLLPWSPLAGGFLSGKYERGGTAPADSRAGSEKPLYQWISEEYAESERNWATIDAVVRIAKQIGATPAQVALSWIADRPGVIAPIIGARTVEHLRNNLGAAELTLDNEATTFLETISAPISGGYPYGAFGAGQRALVAGWNSRTSAALRPRLRSSDWTCLKPVSPGRSPLGGRLSQPTQAYK
jgi:aryl-alcohol dehydrogenase (NADP+)